ncbi:MAG: bifunctional phosphoserine phosphatase/homoserine phosphotransferase ThrH [Sphaerochaetaceae bacterium]|jgi:phosphoserine/homoserine phosphotransferase
MQKIVCMDLEGVLVPEIWINFAEKTKIEKLRLTTRDIADYDVLMQGRLEILDQHNFTLEDIQDVIREMDPLEGAKEFLDELRSKSQLIILSDTFTEFASPLMEKLGWPTLFCNSLVLDSNRKIVDYKLRQKDGKYYAVQALKGINYKVLAAGDSYNDLTMIKEADQGVLFRAPQQIIDDYSHLPSAVEYSDLMKIIDNFLMS